MGLPWRNALAQALPEVSRCCCYDLSHDRPGFAAFQEPSLRFFFQKWQLPLVNRDLLLELGVSFGVNPETSLC